MSQVLVIASDGPLKFGLQNALSYATFWPTGENTPDPLEPLISPRARSVVVLDLVTPPPPALVILDAISSNSSIAGRLSLHQYLTITPETGLPGRTAQWLSKYTNFHKVSAHQPFGAIVDCIHQLEVNVLSDLPKMIQFPG